MIVTKVFLKIVYQKKILNYLKLLMMNFTRQQQHIELIASENIVSQAVLEAQGSVLTNKYAEVILVKDIIMDVNMSMLLKI